MDTGEREEVRCQVRYRRVRTHDKGDGPSKKDVRERADGDPSAGTGVSGVTQLQQQSPVHQEQ